MFKNTATVLKRQRDCEAMKLVRHRMVKLERDNPVMTS